MTKAVDCTHGWPPSVGLVTWPVARAALCLLPVVVGLSLPGCASTPDQTNDLFARINGHAITNTYLKLDLEDKKIDVNDRVAVEAEKDTIVDRIVVELHATRTPRVTFPDLSRVRTIDDFRAQRRNETVLELTTRIEYYRANPVTEDAVKRAYDERSGRWPSDWSTAYRIQRIVLNSRTEAQDVIRSLDAGRPFGQLAKLSLDASTEKTGGEVGWIPAKSDSAANGDSTLQRLRVGQYTEEPMTEADVGCHLFADNMKVNSDSPMRKLPKPHSIGARAHVSGIWCVVRLEDVRTGVVPAYAEARDLISDELLRAGFRNFTKQLRAAASVEILGDDPR